MQSFGVFPGVGIFHVLRVGDANRIQCYRWQIALLIKREERVLFNLLFSQFLPL